MPHAVSPHKARPVVLVGAWLSKSVQRHISTTATVNTSCAACAGLRSYSVSQTEEQIRLRACIVYLVHPNTGPISFLE